MSVFRPSAWFGAAVAIALMAATAWCFFSLPRWIDGVGPLDRLGWPWSTLGFWLAAGAAIGAIGGMIAAASDAAVQRGREEHARLVAETSSPMGFTYQPEASREDLAEFGGLSLFRHWDAARNRMTGRADGQSVELVDYTSVEKSDEGDSFNTQTVALLPAELPTFELRPRELAIRIFDLIDLKGTTFDGATLDKADRAAVRRFGRQYFLSEGLETLIENRGTSGDEASIRQRFTLEVLRFFAERPGWYVQADGRHLALCRRNRVVPADKRPEFLAEVLEVYRALTRPAAVPTEAVPAAGPARDPRRMPARVAGTMVGIFAGFVVGFGLYVAGVLTAVVDGDPVRPAGFVRSSAMFFGTVLGGAFLGAVVGNRLLSRLIRPWLPARWPGRTPPGEP